MPTDAEKIKELEKRIASYENNGPAKLFYALNRKSSELADLLNSQSLSSLDIADAKDKSFERLKIAWNEAAALTTAIKILEGTAGVTSDEAKDTGRPVFRITTPESVADVLGNSAGN